MSGEKILIVEDKPEVARFCQEYLLMPQGYEAVVALDGAQGLEMAECEHPDLIILDFRLPRMSGLDVLRQLRDKQIDVPVIFTTAYGSDEDIVAAFRLGVKDYLTKPFTPAEMISTVERVLAEKRQQEDQARRQKELERQVKRLSTLYGSSLESVLDHIVEAAVAISGAEEGYLLLPDEGRDELYIRSALNVGPSLAEGTRVPTQGTVAGRVLCSGESVRLGAIEPQALLEVRAGHSVQALINVPLHRQGAIIGVLGVDNRTRSGTFTSEDEGLLAELAEHAATVIANASVYQEIHAALVERVRGISVLQEVAHDLNGVVQLQRIVRIVLYHAMRVTPAEAGLFGLRVRSHATWTPSGYLAPAVDSGTWHARWDAGAIGRAVASRAPVCVNDTHAARENTYTVPQTRSQLAVPIRRGDQVLGVIDVESTRAGAFGADEEQMLLAIADRAAVAIENAQLFEAVLDEQRKNELVLQQIADGVCTVDQELTITAFNPAAEQITGWSEEDVLGESCERVFDGPGDAKRYHCGLIVEAIEKGRTVSSTTRAPPIYGRGGSEIFVSSSIAPLYSQEGELEGAIVAFRDVSSERELDRLKSDFVSMVSHEVRSPLANLSAAIDLLIRLTSGQDDVQKALDIARVNESRLTALIEDILSVSRIEAGQVRVSHEPVTLAPILKRLARIAQARTQRHRLILDLPDDVPFVIGDAAKVEIIVNNLLTNAINYSPHGGRILVKVDGPEDGQLIVRVVDEGVGIPPEHMDKVFGRFYRVDTSDGRAVYGHGLGLYISKCLVELQHGRIWADSRLGKGSRFSFSLPVVGEPEAEAEDLGLD